MFWGTPSTQFIPWWQTAWETILEGHLPLWNPGLGMGAPLLANYQSALLYPPTWIYFLLWLAGSTPAMAWGMALMVALHLAWASLGMALLLRQIKQGLLSQVIAGLAYGLSGYLVARAGFLSINAATAWTPWVILGVTWLIDELVKVDLGKNSQIKEEGLSARLKFRKVIIAGLFLCFCIGFQLLSGHAQSTWYSLGLAGIWAIFWVYYSYRHAYNTRPAIKFVLKCTMILFGIILVAVGLAAVQLLPTMEYLLQSQRAGAVDYDFAMAYSFWPWRWLTLLAPGLFGNPVSGDYWGYANYWEDAIYIGLTPFLLALAAVINRQRRTKLVIFLVILTLVAALLSMGQNTPVFPWLYRNFPTFDMFQAPTRINLLVVFSLSVLAGIGANSWRRPTGHGLYWTRLGTMAAAAVTVGAFLASLAARQGLGDLKPSLIRATALAGLWGIGLGVLTLTAPQKSEDQFATKKGTLWAWAAILWVAADLVVAGWGLNPGIDLDFYRQTPQTAKTIQNLAGDGRLYLLADDEKVLKFEKLFRYDTFNPFPAGEGWEFLRATMLPNLSSLDHILSANNFDPLLPGRYVTWIEALNKADDITREQLLNLMAVNVVEVVDGAQPGGLDFIPRQALPRVRWVPCGTSVQDGSAALAALSQDGESPTEVVLLETSQAPIHADCSSDEAAKVEIVAQHASGMEFVIESDSPGYLVLADVWYPGWSARLDGQPETIWRANYLFKAVEIPSGEHWLSIAYRPTWFYMGFAISCLAWVGFGGMIYFIRRFST